jgi:Integrase core domain
VLGLLLACWELSDRICSKRLAPFLPELLAQLQRCDALPAEATPALIARVSQMSAATLDRLLAPERGRAAGAGRGTTKPGTLLKGQVPIKTFADRDGTRPGCLQLDLVAHCGPTGAGEFLFTLSAVDVATGWSVCVGVRNKGQDAVGRAIELARTRLPVPLLGLDSDNGSEFLNHALLRYCRAEGITFTRSRPYRKNDTCHVEQKNWSVVRRLVRYSRFEWPARAPLAAVYRLADDYVNFFQPVLKLREKVRDGARVTKRYDRAQTPYQRLLASGVLSAHATASLAERYAHLHPGRLKLALEDAQQTLLSKAVRAYSPLRQRMSFAKSSS